MRVNTLSDAEIVALPEADLEEYAKSLTRLVVQGGRVFASRIDTRANFDALTAGNYPDDGETLWASDTQEGGHGTGKETPPVWGSKGSGSSNTSGGLPSTITETTVVDFISNESDVIQYEFTDANGTHKTAVGPTGVVVEDRDGKRITVNESVVFFRDNNTGTDLVFTASILNTAPNPFTLLAGFKTVTFGSAETLASASGSDVTLTLLSVEQDMVVKGDVIRQRADGKYVKSVIDNNNVETWVDL